MDRSTHPFDVEEFRLNAGLGVHAADEVVSERRLPTRKERERKSPYTKYPSAWDKQLKGANWQTFVTAHRILYLYWKGNGEPFTLSNVGLTEVGVTRKGKYRALKELERRSLITVERSPRKSPLVTVTGPVP
jgi:hypothetical protein